MLRLTRPCKGPAEISGGILRVEGKVNAFFPECGAQWIGLSGPNFQVSFHDGAALSPNLRTTFSKQTMFHSTAADTVWRVA
jgi:hypothetical protein